MMNTTDSALLTLPEIAAWQVAQRPAKAGSIVAALPALQRGAVWKVKQVEELWDSLLRRFPVGSFVIAPPNQAMKQQGFKLQSDQAGMPPPTHLLLDGQQRATGIALGFYDIWSHTLENAPSALWIDLAPPPDSREADLIFRVLTRAHPWGYKRSKPDETLPAHQIRAALAAFRAANKLPTARPEELQLQQTWPWDAEAPVPFALLVAAVSSHPDNANEAKAAAWRQIENLPMFSKADRPEGMSDDAYNKWQKQCQSVRDAFENKNHDLAYRLDFVLQRLQDLLNPETAYRIPALPLDLQSAAQSAGNEDVASMNAVAPVDAAKKDPLELLFVRINSAGTPLQGEELIYSMLKAAWPDAADFINKLDHKPALPSRIAMLCVRLVLARRQKPDVGRRLSPPPTPGIDEFRRLVRDQNPQQPNFFADLQDFIRNEANDLFTKAWNFLTAKPYALLPVLAVELAQKSADVYFLLLRWLDRLDTEAYEKINDEIHRRTLGFLTAVAWFAPDHNKACSAIWHDLQTDDRIGAFFNSEQFKKTCRRDQRLNLRMIPLPSVEELELACKKHVIGGDPGSRETIKKDDSTIWSKWNWYESFANRMAGKEVAVKWSEWLVPENGVLEDDYAPDEVIRQVTSHFADRLYESRQVLLYAQRDWLKTWYPHFDPSQPETMEDHNRPWDYDHILPQNLLHSESGNSRRNIPQLIWDWCGSIGNLRSWPLEANRSDSDTSPTVKMEQVSAEEQLYGMTVPVDERKASFVHEDIDWPHWLECVPMNEDGETVENRRYLALRDYHDYRKSLIKAIVLRFIELYRAWYDELRIDKLQ